MKNTVLSAVLALLPALLPADDRGTAEPKPVVTPVNALHERSFDFQLVPQIVEFEGFLDDHSATQTSSTNVLGQPIFSTRKVMTSVSVFDGKTVVLGGLMHEDVQKVDDKTDDSGASNLQILIRERDQLKQRLREVEALIKKHAKE